MIRDGNDQRRINFKRSGNPALYKFICEHGLPGRPDTPEAPTP
jgi:hypothetical protein